MKKLRLPKIYFIILLFLFGLTGCNGMEDLDLGEEVEETDVEEMDIEEDTTSEEDVPFVGTSWRNIEVTEVLTGNSFTINDFSDKPIILESFAVWCPVCKKQQDKIKDLHEEIGDSAISISLDTDPNEDAALVKSHAEINNFDWYFAVSPVEMTESLIDEFGLGVVSAPSAPVVIVCPDGSATKLRNGVKDAAELKSEIEAC